MTGTFQEQIGNIRNVNVIVLENCNLLKLISEECLLSVRRMFREYSGIWKYLMEYQGGVKSVKWIFGNAFRKTSEIYST